MLKLFFSAFLTIFILNLPVYSQTERIDLQSYHWADSILKTLKPEEKIGQLFMVAAYSSGNEQHHHVLEQLIKNYGIGGIIFMQGGPMRQAKLTNRFQAQSKIPLFIGMDMEWGLAMRLDSTIRFPKQMTLGALQDDYLIYEMGVEIGQQMNRLGVHVAFAPVADINSNPLNPVIGSRSFGENTQLVSEKVKAYMHGLQESGIIAVAKHFPGDGDTEIDSHKSLPTITASRDVLNQREISPFKTVIEAGISGIMTGHLLVPALSEKEVLPATIEPLVVKDLLKEQLGFQGLAFTDAMNMKSIANVYQDGTGELKAFKAGNDIILFSTQVPLAIKRIKKAVKRDKELQQQLDNTVRTILEYKYKCGLTTTPTINTDNLILDLNNNEAMALKHELYRKSLTLASNKNNVLPIKELGDRYFAHLSFQENIEFKEALDYYTNFAYYSWDANSQNILFNKLKNYDVLIANVTEKVTDEQLELLKRLKSETDLVLCHSGSSYSLDKLDEFRTIIHTEEHNPMTQNLLAEAVFGAISIEGRLPVSANSSFEIGTGTTLPSTLRLTHDIPENVGMNARTLSGIDQIIQEALEDQATPGGQVIVARRGKVIYENNFGFYTYDSLIPVTYQTIYDVASITKVAATLQALMFLYERGIVDIEKKLSYYLPDLKGTNKEDMLIIDILTHQAGLWPYLPFWRQTLEDSTYIQGFYNGGLDAEFQYHVAPGLYATKHIKDSVWNWVKDSKLIKKKERVPYSYRYSDIGYYLLQRFIEKNLNQSMEQFLQYNIYNPMGMSSTGYLPLCNFPFSRIAPTEQDNYFRNSLVYGMVHDQGAALVGGVAGHAGLFSNARDLAKLMQMHLQGGIYGEHRFFQPGTLGTFTKQQYETNRRGLGWDKPATGLWYGPCSRFASYKTFGHTGFTGTAAWVDPEFELVYIFIANRIHPDATNRKLIQNNIRTRIQEVIYKSIWDYEQYGNE